MDRYRPPSHPNDPDPNPGPRPERDPDDARDQQLDDERDASLHRWLVACDRAAYEARHGTLDEPADRFRADWEP